MGVSSVKTGSPEARAQAAAIEFTNMVAWAHTMEKLHPKSHAGMSLALMMLVTHITSRAGVDIETAKKTALAEWEVSRG